MATAVAIPFASRASEAWGFDDKKRATIAIEEA